MEMSPATDSVLLAVEAVRGMGWVGPIIFALFYIITTLLLIPGSVISLLAGFIYGPIYGVAITSPASVLGATIAFALSRTALRPRIEKRIHSKPFLLNLDQAIKQSGFKLIALLRLSPIFPFVILNYSLGLTRARLSDYVLASLLGMFPATVLYCYLGSAAYTINEVVSGQRESTPAETLLYWIGLLATGLVAVLITRMSRKALSELTNNEELGNSRK